MIKKLKNEQNKKLKLKILKSIIKIVTGGFDKV